jgi:hypothetical protein
MAGGVAAITPVITERVRPVALAREQVLPVISPLTTLLPQGLVRGTTVAIDGCSGVTSLALAIPGRRRRVVGSGGRVRGSISARGRGWWRSSASRSCLLQSTVRGRRSSPLVDAIDVVLVCPPQRSRWDARVSRA